MARPRKRRRVCGLPGSNRFGPLDLSMKSKDIINMTVDEYETIRLIDLEGLTQQECADQMSVARTTVQGIYATAREKLAQVLVNNSMLTIEGGEYKLCDEFKDNCGGRRCHRHRGGRG